MPSFLKGPWPSILLAFLHMIAQYASRPLISLHAVQIGGTIKTVGLIFSAYYVIQLALALLAGAAVDRWGSRRPAAAGSLLLTLGLVLTALSVHWWTLLVAQMISGAAYVITHITYQAHIGGLPNREHNIGLLTFGVSGGMAIGPVLGGAMADLLGMVPAFWIAAIISLLPLAVVWLIPGSSARQSRNGSVWGFELLREGALVRAMMVGAVVLFTMDVLTTYFPLYGQQLGLSASAIGMVLTVRALSAMVTRPFMGWIATHLGRERLLAVSLVLGGIFIALFAAVSSFWLLVLMAVMVGLALGLAAPMTLVMVAELAPEHLRGQAMALRIMGNRIGQTVSPMIFGVLAGILGIGSVFWIGGGLLALSYGVLGRKEKAA